MSVTVHVMLEITLKDELTNEVIEQEISDVLTENGGIHSECSLDALAVRVKVVED